MEEKLDIYYNAQFVRDEILQKHPTIPNSYIISRVPIRGTITGKLFSEGKELVFFHECEDGKLEFREKIVPFEIRGHVNDAIITFDAPLAADVIVDYEYSMECMASPVIDRVANARYIYGECLSRLSQKEQVAEITQFFVDMMDWTEQSDAEEIYIALEECAKKFNV